MTITEAIAQAAVRLGLPLDADAPERLAAHLALVGKWNKVHNLTAVRDMDQMVTLHTADSLSILPEFGGSRSVVDVGTGAGFPGIPIAIVRPSVEVTLLDSSHKKCSFLEQVKAELALRNVTIVCDRVERWRPAQGFDTVVSRAFADLGDFIAQAAHLVAPGGRLLAMKGVYPYEEIARVPGTHRVAEVRELHVPDLDAKRHLVRVEAAA